jgi:hypothetical protein
LAAAVKRKKQTASTDLKKMDVLMLTPLAKIAAFSLKFPIRPVKACSYEQADYLLTNRAMPLYGFVLIYKVQMLVD